MTRPTRAPNEVCDDCGRGIHLAPELTVMQRVQVVEDALERLFRHRYGFDIEHDAEGRILYVADPVDPESTRTGISLFSLARELEAML